MCIDPIHMFEFLNILKCIEKHLELYLTFCVKEYQGNTVNEVFKQERSYLILYPFFFFLSETI